MYKCIEEFHLAKCDEDGFTVLEDEYLSVEEGSIWHIPEDKDFRLIGGDIRLENDEEVWIEISEETLAENFEKIN